MRRSAYLTHSEEALERALTRVPAYARWSALDPGPDFPLDERYAALPATDKSFMRSASPGAFVPDGRELPLGIERGEVELVATSGTTDERVTNIWNQRWWDFSEQESWRLNPLLTPFRRGPPREAILTSALNVGFLDDSRSLAFEERTSGRLLYLNERSTPLLWDESLLLRMVAELRRFRPQVLEANPSYLARFARWAARVGLQVPEPDIIVFTYENPSLLHLRQIRRVFRAPFASSYGTTEAGYVFVQCEAGTMHLNEGSCRVDFVPLPGAAAEVGTLRVTPFGNEWVSLLRYDPGDLVRLRTDGPCPCGRGGPLTLESIEGRTKSLTRTTDGRPVTQGELDRRLATEGSLVAYQLVQSGAREFRLGALSEGPERRGALGRLRDALTDLYGREAIVRVDECEDLEPEPSGKYLLARGPE